MGYYEWVTVYFSWYILFDMFILFLIFDKVFLFETSILDKDFKFLDCSQSKI